MATAKSTKSAALKSSVPSTAVAVKKPSSGALVSLADKMAADVAALAGKTAPASGDVIQITQDKHFKLPDGTKTQGPLEMVIVDFNSANFFYEGAFDPNNISPPACFAIGDTPTALVPSDNSPNRQCDSCSGCPMNQFGSAGNGKACKNSRVLAVLPPDADAETPLWVLRVSPTALKAFDSYVTSVARQFQRPPYGVVTEVSFDPSVTYASLRFNAVAPLEEIVPFASRSDEAKKRLLVEPDVSQYDVPQPPKKAAAGGRRR